MTIEMSRTLPPAAAPMIVVDRELEVEVEKKSVDVSLGDAAFAAFGWVVGCKVAIGVPVALIWKLVTLNVTFATVGET